MQLPSRELVERLLETFNARDSHGLANAFHPECEVWPTDEYLPAGTSYHGREGLATVLREGLPGLPGVRAELVRFEDFGARAAAFIRVTVDNWKPRDSYWVYTFEDDLVKRAEQYPSASAALSAAERPAILTPRERQVFQLLARGLNGREIAEQLMLSPETVRTHVQNGVERLGAKTRVQAVAVAIDRGEISQ